jgi:hypothetical protein
MLAPKLINRRMVEGWEKVDRKMVVGRRVEKKVG